ncbi:hypothetical protein P9112_008401 [Eukaryota sp. TZLM1-RC]
MLSFYRCLIVRFPHLSVLYFSKQVFLPPSLSSRLLYLHLCLLSFLLRCRFFLRCTLHATNWLVSNC